MKETIVVEVNGKFGPKVGGVWYSFSKKFAGNKELALNTPIDVEIWAAESGKKYINSVLGVGSSLNDSAVLVSKENKLTKGTVVLRKASENQSSASTAMSKDEWQAKDTRISRQGCIQVAVQVTGGFDEAVILADKMLAYVNGAK